MFVDKRTASKSFETSVRTGKRHWPKLVLGILAVAVLLCNAPRGESGVLQTATVINGLNCNCKVWIQKSTGWVAVGRFLRPNEQFTVTVGDTANGRTYMQAATLDGSGRVASKQVTTPIPNIIWHAGR